MADLNGSIVMELTGGDGVGRLLECTGAEYMVNNCFSLLRYFHIGMSTI